MRALIQRVTNAAVDAGGERLGAIDCGLLVLVAAGPNDGPKEAAWMAGKVARLRVFSDAAGKMNLALADVGGSQSTSTTAGSPGGGEAGAPKATVAQAAVKVGDLPVNLAHGQEALWVTNRLGNSVSEVDGDPGKQVAEYPLDFRPRGHRGRRRLDLGRGYNSPTLVRLDPRRRRRPEPDLGRHSSRATSPSRRLDLGRKQRHEHDLEGRHQDRRGAHDCRRLGPLRDRVGRRRDLGHEPRRRHDPADQQPQRQPRRPDQGGLKPKGIAVADGAEWVANAGE